MKRFRIECNSNNEIIDLFHLYNIAIEKGGTFCCVKSSKCFVNSLRSVVQIQWHRLKFYVINADVSKHVVNPVFVKLLLRIVFRSIVILQKVTGFLHKLSCKSDVYYRKFLDFFPVINTTIVKCSTTVNLSTQYHALLSITVSCS